MADQTLPKWHPEFENVFQQLLDLGRRGPNSTAIIQGKEVRHAAAHGAPGSYEYKIEGHVFPAYRAVDYLLGTRDGFIVVNQND